MSMLDALRQIVETTPPMTGRVVAIVKETVVVATRRGRLELSKGGPMSVGDIVQIHGRIATRLTKNNGPIFHV